MKSNQAATLAGSISAKSVRRGIVLILTAVGFVLFYLAADLVTSNLATAPLPRPDAPGEEARAWFVENGTAAFVLGLCQLLSVMSLAMFVLGLRTVAVTREQARAAARAWPWGLAAVGLMVASTLLAWVLAFFAPSLSTGVFSLIRTANFIAGGTAHVIALGLFALYTSKIKGFPRSVRVLAVVAAVPAFLSVASIVVWQAAALILLGRLLCMAWVVSAAVSVTRRLAKGTWGPR